MISVSMKVKSYKELIVWQKAMDVAEEAYTLVNKLPKDEQFALSNQIRRAAISIPSNIAEGQSRNSTKEFIHFLGIANGSKSELETQLRLCVKIGYLKDDEIIRAMDNLQEVGKMIYALIKKLTTTH